MNSTTFRRSIIHIFKKVGSYNYFIHIYLQTKFYLPPYKSLFINIVACKLENFDCIDSRNLKNTQNNFNQEVTITTMPEAHQHPTFQLEKERKFILKLLIMLLLHIYLRKKKVQLSSRSVTMILQFNFEISGFIPLIIK